MSFNFYILNRKSWEENYYLSIRNNERTHVNVTTEIFTIHCRYYDSNSSEWSTYGSFVLSDETTIYNIGCSYNHMTLYGSSALKYFKPSNFGGLTVSSGSPFNQEVVLIS